MNNYSKILNYLMTIALLAFVSTGCPSSSGNQILAQNNSDLSKTSKTDSNIAKELYPLCEYRTEKAVKDFSFSTENSPINKLYEIINAGFLKEIQLEEAISLFNEAAKCNEIAKSQTVLTSDELIAAIRDWDCTQEKDENYKKVCSDAWKIAQTRKMPRGSFIDYNNGLGGEFRPRGYRGSEVEYYEIYLYLWLDKYRRDMKDSPVYFKTIRLSYISSKQKQEKEKID